MNKIIKKPHLIFLCSIPILILIGILSGDATLDINIHDTYIIIAYLHLPILISILFGIIGVGYWLMEKTNRQLSKWLNRIHIGLTFGGMIVVLILSRFYRKEPTEYEFNSYLTATIMLITLCLVIVQIIFPINIIYGLIKKKNNS